MRLTREAMFEAITDLVAQRSTCERAHVGTIIVKDNRIISMGYGGAPTGMPHCSEVGCEINPGTKGCDRTVHAEANAIAFAAKQGLALDGSTMYVNLAPCRQCAKLIINCGIKYLIYKEEYRDNEGILLLKRSKVKVEKGWPWGYEGSEVI